jgi:predicted CopG family antitoxin
MGTTIRVTDDLRYWLQEHRQDGEAYEDVIRRSVNELDPRPGPVREA